jgi:DNA-binding CsgD family transcriptional regulator
VSYFFIGLLWLETMDKIEDTPLLIGDTCRGATYPSELSDLIGCIYDAAIDPLLLATTLGKIRAYLHGAASVIYFESNSKINRKLFCDDGCITSDALELYFNKYIEFDPTAQKCSLERSGKPTAISDVMSYADFLETRFYKEWSYPQGLGDKLIVVLDKSRTGTTLLSVFCHDRNGPVDAETHRRMRFLAPHLRRAMLIGRQMDSKAAEASTFCDTLDGLATSMFLVDANARIIHANARGNHLISMGDLLSSTGGQLFAKHPHANMALHNVLAAGTGISLPLISDGGERYVVHVLPLSATAQRWADAGCTAISALFVHKVVLDAPSAPEIMARAYNLTSSELRVLLGIMEVGGVPETAEALGISQPTVKTHLRHLFAKTGVSRQADLVKLVASYSSPLLR